MGNVIPQAFPHLYLSFSFFDFFFVVVVFFFAVYYLNAWDRLHHCTNHDSYLSNHIPLV